MPWARASALGRHLECPAASWLPRGEGAFDGLPLIDPPYLGERMPEPVVPDLLLPRDRSAAERGTRAHAMKEAGEAYLDLYSGLDPDGHHEATFSYDCRTGEVECFLSPSRADRDAWKASRGPNCVVGTADWINGLGDWVDDLKTGWRAPDAVTPQTLFYALCLYDTWRWPEPLAEIRVTATHDPRAAHAIYTKKQGKAPFRYEDTVSVLELEEFRSDLHRAWLRATHSTHPEPRAGDHCTYCPSAAWCPTSRSI